MWLLKIIKNRIVLSSGLLALLLVFPQIAFGEATELAPNAIPEIILPEPGFVSGMMESTATSEYTIMVCDAYREEDGTVRPGLFDRCEEVGLEHDFGGQFFLIYVGEGETVTEDLLPEVCTAIIRRQSVTQEEDGGHNHGFFEESMTLDYAVQWDLAQDGEAGSQGGDYRITGTLKDPLQVTVSGAGVLLQGTLEDGCQVYEPHCRVITKEIKPIPMPGVVYYYTTDANKDTESYSIISRPNSKKIHINFNARPIMSGTNFSATVVDITGEEEVEIQTGTRIVYDQNTLFFISLEQFLEDEKLYRVELTMTVREKEYRSAPTYIVTSKTAGTLVPPGSNGAEGGSGNDDMSGSDGGGTIPRDGSGRDTQKDRNDKASLSVRDMNTLLKAEKPGANFILSEMKAFVPADLLTAWATTNKEFQIEAKKSSENQFVVALKVDQKAVKALDSAITLRIPIEKTNSLLRGLTRKEAEDLLVAKVNNKIVPTAYYDSETGEMIIKTAQSGTLEIEKGRKKAFRDTKNHWASSTLEFAAARGLISGYADNTYRPDEKINKADFSALMSRCVGQSSLIKKNNGTITRLEAAVVLSQRLEVSGGQKKSEAQKFLDVNQLTEKERAAVDTVYEKDIMKGMGNHQFAPNQELTRGEALQILVNLVKMGE